MTSASETERRAGTAEGFMKSIEIRQWACEKTQDGLVVYVTHSMCNKAYQCS
jgi:hypothetical protein